MGGFEPRPVVMNWGVVKMTYEMEEALPYGVMGGARHPDRIAAKGMEDSGQPFPIAVVHGEEQHGRFLLPPRLAQFTKWIQVQAVPSTGQKEGGLLRSSQEQLPRELGCQVWAHATSQLQDFAFARNGKDPCDGDGQTTSQPLGCRWSKREDHATAVEMGRCSDQGEQT